MQETITRNLTLCVSHGSFSNDGRIDYGYQFDVYHVHMEGGEIVESHPVYRNFIHIKGEEDDRRLGTFLDDVTRSIQRFVKRRTTLCVRKQVIKKAIKEGVRHLQSTSYILKAW